MSRRLVTAEKFIRGQLLQPLSELPQSCSAASPQYSHRKMMGLVLCVNAESRETFSSTSVSEVTFIHVFNPFVLNVIITTVKYFKGGCFFNVLTNVNLFKKRLQKYI